MHFDLNDTVVLQWKFPLRTERRPGPGLCGLWARAHPHGAADVGHEGDQDHEQQYALLPAPF